MSTDLLFLCAERFEMQGFLELFPADSKTLAHGGQEMLTGKAGSATYQLLVTGAGVFNAAAGAAAFLSSGEKPKMIVGTGIAGGFESSGIRVGDVAFATSECYLHAGVGHHGLFNAPLPFELIRGVTETRSATYLLNEPLQKQYLDRFFSIREKEPFQRFSGAFVTVSTITDSKEDAQKIYQVLNPVMEAMEGAAIAHVARMFHCPMLEIRSCSNMAGERDKSLWDIPLAVAHLGKALSFLLIK